MKFCSIKLPEGIKLEYVTVPGSERIKAIVDGIEWGMYSPQSSQWMSQSDSRINASPELQRWVNDQLANYGGRRYTAYGYSKQISKRFPSHQKWELYRVRGTDWHDIYVDDLLWASFENSGKNYWHSYAIPVWLDDTRRSNSEMVMSVQSFASTSRVEK